ncbi:hypothetical protein CBR_g24347 [Chara braunii]|uniref:DUF659 domain-containing protein n=1 Tax=Chara braunii TaxID=69332 RepID=A0A388JMF4_CHABU|nr:hypothetical protein CBR_g24347 [Chara braunii]|eukprot:GBG58999.1 hypothetical protein CBR_g24347 [Chara braunii]
MRPCALRTGEIVHTLVTGGAKVQPSDKNTRYLLTNYKGGEAESDVHRGDASHGEEGLEDPQTDEPQPPPVAGRAIAGIANMLVDALDEAVDAGGAAEGGGGEEGQGSTTRTTTLRQTIVRRCVDNAAKKKLDIAWAEAMFRAGIAFNFLNMDTTQTLHAVYLEVANARPKVKLPSYNYMRTVMPDIIYLKIQKEVNPMTRCWDSTGCTFIIDGSTGRKNRPVMNFLAAGEQGAVLVTTVTMSGRKKNAVALAKLWDQVMREIGLQGINAICTDNAEVNKKAAQILERRKDKDVARILWVPCGAHCCSLLLKDLTNLSWIKVTVKAANTIVKFIRNHHATHDLMMTVDDFVRRNCCELDTTRTAGSLMSGVRSSSLSWSQSTLATDTRDEEMRQRNMAKAPKNRIPQNLLDSDTSDSNDLEDMVWKWKCWNESSSKDCSEDEDSDFELGVVPAVPATTYVGRRTRPQERELELDPTPVVKRVDTDVEFLLHRHDDPDEEEATRAKEMADRDRELEEGHCGGGPSCSDPYTQGEGEECCTTGKAWGRGLEGNGRGCPAYRGEGRAAARGACIRSGRTASTSCRVHAQVPPMRGATSRSGGRDQRPASCN